MAVISSRDVKTVILPLFMVSTVGLAAEPRFDFGLFGTIMIVEAEYWMDGGSVTVTLRDEYGIKAHARYTNDWLYGADNHGGQFSFRAPTAKKATYFRRRGTDEKSLLEILRVACAMTFGTGDPDALRIASRGRDGTIRDFKRAALASLFHQAANRSRDGKTRPNHK